MRQPAHFDVKIRGSARGLPDREFRVTVSHDRGVTVRTAGSSTERTLSWKQILSQVLLHYGDLT